MWVVRDETQLVLLLNTLSSGAQSCIETWSIWRKLWQQHCLSSANEDLHLSQIYEQRNLSASDCQCTCSSYAYVLLISFFYESPVTSWDVVGFFLHLSIHLWHFWIPPEWRDHTSAPDSGCSANACPLRWWCCVGGWVERGCLHPSRRSTRL